MLPLAPPLWGHSLMFCRTVGARPSDGETHQTDVLRPYTLCYPADGNPVQHVARLPSSGEHSAAVARMRVIAGGLGHKGV